MSRIEIVKKQAARYRWKMLDYVGNALRKKKR
jgi:hypothetical protein